MADRTAIEWTDASWNPIRGCTRVKEGCRNCYAEIMTARFSDPGQWGEWLAQIVRGANGKVDHRWTGKTALAPGHMDQPLRWRRPRRIFVCSTSDLFHDSVPDEWIDQVFAVMALCPQHIFQVLTKRPERMAAYMGGGTASALIERWANCAGKMCGDLAYSDVMQNDRTALKNVWLGTSIEDQATADERIPHLLATPAAVRFVSAEPLLGPVDMLHLRRYNARGTPWINALRGLVTRGQYLARSPSECSFNTSTQMIPPELPRLDWVITGGESGPGARPMHPDWARSLRDQCVASGVPFFFKQWGLWTPTATRERRPEWTPGELVETTTVFDRPGWIAAQDHPWSFLLEPLGKGKSGRLLDGRTWDQMPGVPG